MGKKWKAGSEFEVVAANEDRPKNFYKTAQTASARNHGRLQLIQQLASAPCGLERCNTAAGGQKWGLV